MSLKKGIFIVLEGTDGVGKSTQIGLLRAFLKQKGIKHRYIHFPQYKKRPYGDLISRYLSGQFGKAEEVNPYLTSLLYAGDRSMANHILKGWIDEGFIVVADRYILSNIAYQRAKMDNETDKKDFTSWIQQYEYRYNKILRPNLTIFLDAPDDFIISRLSEDRGSRSYLQDSKDIHESDIPYQKKVINEYRLLSKSIRGVCYIKCYDDQGVMMPPQRIHQMILRILQRRFAKVFKY
ncbi:MAG: thymidylate kinase [Thermodesulfovibrionales bacterium]